MQIEDAMLMFDKVTQRHRGEFINLHSRTYIIEIFENITLNFGILNFFLTMNLEYFVSGRIENEKLQILAWELLRLSKPWKLFFSQRTLMFKRMRIKSSKSFRISGFYKET